MKRAVIALLSAVTGCSSQTVKPVEWEHGWKTPRVVATRYHSDVMGWNIGFRFPKDFGSEDRSEVSWFIEDNNGSIYQGGGSPGAEAFAVFKDVKDRASADAKLKAILPGLDKRMRDIAAGVKIPEPKPRKIVGKDGREWPECVPPDPKDPYGEFNNNMNVNGTQYLCSAEGRWVVDEKSMEWKLQRQAEQYDLLAALGSRKLTHAELMQVTPYLNTFEMQSFFPCVKYAELYDLLIRQWELQTGQEFIGARLSRTLGEYNRCSYENESKVAVEQLIAKLQKLGVATTL